MGLESRGPASGKTTRGNNETSGTPDQTPRLFSESPADSPDSFLAASLQPSNAAQCAHSSAVGSSTGPNTTVVIFLLRSGESSESMANHDSEVMVWLCSCRDDAGIAGVGIEGCERSDAAAVRAGANGGECRLVSGWVAQRGAA